MLVLVRPTIGHMETRELTMNDFLMRPEDEMTHAPDTSVNFNESVYTNGFDTGSPVGGWMRLGNRVNEGYAELSVCLYLPDGRIACQFQRPNITRNDRFEAGGLSYSVIEPLKKVSMTFDGELLIVDDPNALRDPKTLFANGPRRPATSTGFTRRNRQCMAASRTTMPCRPCMGAIFRSAISTSTPACAARSASGARPCRSTAAAGAIIRGGRATGRRSISIGCSSPIFRTATASCSSRSPTRTASRRVGVLLVDGQYEEIIDMDLPTEWTEQKDPRRVEIGVRTANRKAMITGEIITLAPLRNRRKANGKTLESRIAEGFTRFTWDGRQGYGMTEYIERIEGGRLVGYPL